MITRCPRCQARVLVRPDGSCPACGQLIRATTGSSAPAQATGATQSPMGSATPSDLAPRPLQATSAEPALVLLTDHHASPIALSAGLRGLCATPEGAFALAGRDEAHLLIDDRADGGYVARVLEPRAPVTVNDAPPASRRLEHGDRIAMGRATALYAERQLDEAALSTARAARAAATPAPAAILRFPKPPDAPRDPGLGLGAAGAAGFGVTALALALFSAARPEPFLQIYLLSWVGTVSPIWGLANPLLYLAASLALFLGLLTTCSLQTGRCDARARGRTWRLLLAYQVLGTVLLIATLILLALLGR